MSRLRDWLRRQIGVNPAKVMAELGSEFISEGIDKMAKVNEKIHVLADETLGGTLREYVEVDRKAEVGDLVIRDGIFRKVTMRSDITDGVEFDGYYKDETDEDNDEKTIGWSDGYYATLEPTDIVHIKETYEHGKWDTVRYRLVDRKAEVGERVLVKMDADADEHNLGKVYEVIGIDGELVDTSGFYDDDSTLNLLQEDYRVLVPVESEKESTSPQSTDDIIANLVARVSQTERDMLELIEIVQKDRRNILDKIDGVKVDIETWAQEHEKTKRELDDKIEMVIDDIVTLDARTEHISPINARRCCECRN